MAKLAALDEFKSQKEELLAKLASNEQQIQMLENEHMNKLYEVDKKNVLDKDRSAFWFQFFGNPRIKNETPLIKTEKGHDTENKPSSCRFPTGLKQTNGRDNQAYDQRKCLNQYPIAEDVGKCGRYYLTKRQNKIECELKFFKSSYWVHLRKFGLSERNSSNDNTKKSHLLLRAASWTTLECLIKSLNKEKQYPHRLFNKSFCRPDRICCRIFIRTAEKIWSNAGLVRFELSLLQVHAGST